MNREGTSAGGAERRERLLRHVRLGWRLIDRDPAYRQQALAWLALHPSARPEVDQLWREGLSGLGPVAAWLAAGAAPDDWHLSVPLRSFLASYPFPDLLRCSSPRTSLAS